MTQLNWTSERPTKPGEYWLSIEPSRRMGLHSVLPVVLECNQTTSLHVRVVGDDGGWLGLSRGGWLDGAQWAERTTPEDPFAKSEHKQYVILDTRQIVGNCAMFWRPDGAGYTCDLNDAGLYDKTEGRRETDIYVPIEVARSMTMTHVRVEPLKRAGYWSKPQPQDTRPQRCDGCSRFVKRGG